MKQIHALDKHTVNKIAAGEVVERPRSVDKELVENALDAGADTVTVTIGASPSDFLEVSDNGDGIPFKDIPLAFQRHATSKIISIDDLESLNSLGFRGEALPSIASVSRCTLITRSKEEAHGGKLEIVGGKQTLFEAAGRGYGTTVRVENLFYNVPARRKFLKTAAYEARLIRQFMESTALLTAADGVELILKQEEKEILHVRKEEGLHERIEALFGEAVARSLTPVQRRNGESAVSGFVSNSDAVNRNSAHMYFFVNGRPVKDRSLVFTVKNAMQELLPPGYYPFTFLFVLLPPDKIDVNVHPQKSEVRFAEERHVYGNIHKAVREAFAAIEGIPGADGVAEELQAWHDDIRDESFYNRSGEAGQTSFPEMEGSAFFSESREITLGNYVFTAILFRRYLLFSAKESLLLIDFHALNERLVYDRLKGEAGQCGRAKIIPEALSLGAAYTALISSYQKELFELGFLIRPFGEDTVVVEEIPDAFSASPDLEALIRDLCQVLEEGGEPSHYRDALARRACKASLRTGDRLSSEDIRFFASALETGGFTMTCPHGRPVARILAQEEIDRYFKRS